MRATYRLLVAWIVALLPATLLAQQPPATQPVLPLFFLDRTKQIVGELNLSDQQKSKIDSLFSAAEQKIKDFSPQERMQPLREVMKDLHGQIIAVLDDKQREWFEQKIDQMRQGRAGGPADAFARLRESLDQLDLSDEQKPQVKAALEETAKQFVALRRQGQNGEELRDKGREIFTDVRERLQAILTAEQQAKLRDLMQRAERPQSDKPATPKKPEKTPEEKPADEIQVGQAAPDFELKKLDGRPIRLSSLKGRVVVLAFGSYSAPTFRDKAPALDQLSRDLGIRATLLLIYTKEAHPVGGWEVERNKDQNIKIEQHKTEADRLARAKYARDALKLNHLVIAIDQMDDATANGYSTMPNGVVVVGRDGTIVARQRWLEPVSLRRIIEQTASTPAGGN